MAEIPTEAGWYNDPEGVHTHQAYWDGEKWTGATRSGRGKRVGVGLGVTIGLGGAGAMLGFLLMLAGGTGNASGLNQFTMLGAILFLAGLALLGVGLVAAVVVSIVGWRKQKATSDS